jgi:ABC-type glycerol-3-phosphate transport system permease component
MFPLAATLFGTVFLLFFISYWNDYQVPLMFLRNLPTLALGLYGFMLHDHSEFATPTAKIAAGVCVFIPVFAVFVAFRNKIMGNLTEGGIKG